MFVDPAVVGLVFRLAVVLAIGLVVAMAFVVVTVDRLIARVAELEGLLVTRDSCPCPPVAGRRAAPRGVSALRPGPLTVPPAASLTRSRSGVAGRPLRIARRADRERVPA
jgi:hypothetical protein